MTVKHENLAAALAAFQAALPSVTKGSKGQVRGNPNYKYANLADISAAVLPLLAEHGLSFSSKPTLNSEGRFVLAYALRHESGGSDEGAYSLSDTADPQAIGSAITYARRYVLSAMTGVTPDEDDDGQAAKAAHDNARQRPAQPPKSAPSGPSVADAVAELKAACEANGWNRDIVAVKYAEKAGHGLGDATDAALIESFRKHLFTLPQAELQPAAKEAAA